MHPHGFPKTNLRTKHEVPSSNSEQDLSDRARTAASTSLTLSG